MLLVSTINNPLTKGEGMKTFKIAQLLAVVALFVVGSVSARCCVAKKSCEKVCRTCPVVTIPGEEVEYQKITRTSCGNPGEVRYVLKKEFIPCTNEDKEIVQTLKGCPKYLGTFDENGNPVDEVARHNQ